MKNWKDIKEKYPKAFKSFYEWFWVGFNDPQFTSNGALKLIQTGDKWFSEAEINFSDTCELRKFYDFFDEQGIIIEIMWYHKDFRMNVWYNKEVKFAGHLNSRQEAEEAAFTKAFEILEKKL